VQDGDGLDIEDGREPLHEGRREHDERYVARKFIEGCSQPAAIRSTALELARPSRTPSDLRPHAGHKFLDGDGLDEVVIGASVEATDAIGFALGSRDENDGQSAGEVIGPDLSQGLETVQVRHLDIEKEDRDLTMPVQQGNGFLPVGGQQCPEAFALQCLLKEGSGRRIVIGDHDDRAIGQVRGVQLS
jgi:hypothetical protein